MKGLPNRILALAVLGMGCSDYNLLIKQGNDVFYQEPAAEVDILLAVDNSCSMDPYQAKLGENFASFLTYLEEAQVLYQIGVVTTTIDVPEPVPEYGCDAADIREIPEGGHLVQGTWINNETAGAESVFTDLVGVGSCGAGSEMGLESAYRALTPPLSVQDNLGFLRDDANLSLIFVSDEEDSSPLPVNDYINAFRDVKGQRDRDVFNASALVVKDADECVQEINAGSSVGSRYVDVAEQTDGVLANICAEDFADILTEISLRASRLQDRFYLTMLPIPNSLAVYVYDPGMDEDVDEIDPIPCSDGVWTYENEGEGRDIQGVVVFERASLPSAQSKIIIRYDYGDGDLTGFCTGTSGDTGGAR